MLRLLLLFLIFPLFLFGQLSPKFGGSIPNNTTPFGVNFSQGVTVYDTLNKKFYISTSPIISTDNLSTASDKFKEISISSPFINVKEFGVKGNGTTDDLSAINSVLQLNYSLYIFPSGTYKVSGTISIPSNKHIILAPDAILYLEDDADTLLIANEDYENGNNNIIIEGGTWDGNGHNQTDKVGTGTDPNTWHGTLARFQNVNGLQINRVTIKDPNWFGIHIGRVSNFTISNLVFDYRNKGGDGLHISGLCNHGFVQNLRDPYGARDDDFVAIMSADAQVFDITPGEIHNIIVDGVFSEPTGASAVFKSGVDFLDCGAGIHDITINNIIGEFSYAGIQFMNFGECDSRDSYIYNIHLNNIDINIPDNSAMGPIIIRTDVKNLKIDGLTRRQSGDTYIPTIQIVDAHIGDLIINNVQIADSTNNGLQSFIYALDTTIIDNLTISNYSSKRLEDPASSVIVLLDQVAEVGNLNASNLYVENSSEEGIFDIRLGSGIGSLNISNSTFNNCNVLVSVNVQDQDTAYLNNLNLSNINYTPYSGTTEVIKLLYNILDTVHIRTSNVNFNGFENNPILKYPEEDVKIRLNGFDFFVDPADLNPRRYDMVNSNAPGGPKGPVIYDGSEWVSLYEISIDTLYNALTFIKNTTIEDVDLASSFAGGIVRFGLSPNPTVGLRAGITSGYSPYFQGVASSSSTVPVYIQPFGGQTVFGDKDSTTNAGVVFGDDLYTEGLANTQSLRVRSVPLSGSAPSHFLSTESDGDVIKYPYSPGMENPMTNVGDMIITGGDGVPERLGIGLENQVLVSNGTTPYWNDPVGTRTNPFDTVFANNIIEYNNNKKLVLFGNSIIVLGLFTNAEKAYESSRGFYNWGNAYLGFPFEDPIMKGVGGSTTSDMLSRFRSDVVSYSPGYCLIEGGVNDNDSATVVFSNLRRLYDSCIINHIRPIATTVTPSHGTPGFTEATNRQYIKLNQMIRDYCNNNNIPCVDFAKEVVRTDTASFRWIAGYSTDFLHPNLVGAAAMGKAYYNALRSIVAPSDRLPKVVGEVNILTKNCMMTGTSGTNETEATVSGDIATNFKVNSTSTAILSKVSRVYGEWQKIVISSDGVLDLYCDSITSGFSVGDTVCALAEAKVNTGFSLFNGIQLTLYFYNGSTRLWEQTFNHMPTPANYLQVIQPEWMLKTSNIVIPSTTNKIIVKVTIKAGAGTFYIGRLCLRKIVSLSTNKSISEPYGVPLAGLKNTETGLLLDGDFYVSRKVYADGGNSDLWNTIAEMNSSPWLDNGSEVYYTGGKVGIGTASPSATLSVFSQKSSTHPLFIKNSIGGGAGADTSMIFSANGSLGINITSPLTTFHIYSNYSPAAYIDSYGGNPQMKFRRVNAAASPNVKSTNNIGSIAGTGHNGTSLITTTRAMVRMFAGEDWTSTGNGAGIDFQTTANGGTSTTVKVTIDPSGNLGIGTPSPSSKLDVVGRIEGDTITENGVRVVLQSEIITMGGSGYDSTEIKLTGFNKKTLGYSSGFVIDTILFVGYGAACNVTMKVFYGNHKNDAGTAVVTAGNSITSVTATTKVYTFNNATIPKGALIWAQPSAITTVPRSIDIIIKGHRSP